MRFIFLILFIFSSVTDLYTQESKGCYKIPDFDSVIMLNAELPVAYDLRKTGRLGDVKSQPNGGCWASAAMGSVESVRRTFGCENEVLSDINLKLFHGFVPERSTNGNHLMATAYFTRLSGPLVKGKDTDSVLQLLPKTLQITTDARYLPNHHETVKKAIMDFGAVYSMMYFRKNETDTLTNVYYTNTVKINHAVILAGWNDTITTKKGKGVWLAQNSLGKKFCDNGFFYIPYQDPNILEYNAIWTYWLPYDQKIRIYYYDTLGAFHSYGFRDTVCYGLVKFTAENDISITKVASHINFAGSKIYAEIYDQFDTITKELSGLLGVTQEKNCRFAGYYTIELAKPVVRDKGKDFYVLMKYITPSDTLPLPVETYVVNYADPHITAKKCWINPNFMKWPTTWYECGTESKYTNLLFDLCIRVYCIERKKLQ